MIIAEMRILSQKQGAIMRPAYGEAFDEAVNVAKV